MSETFILEEELNRALERHGQIHDCLEAKCSVNPRGEKIPRGKPQKRPELPGKIRRLLKELRGIEL